MKPILAGLFAMALWAQYVPPGGGGGAPSGAAGGSLAGTYPNPTIGTLGQNLLFTDATYDIGASGATRPRDIFTSRDVTVGRNLTVGTSLSVGNANLVWINSAISVPGTPAVAPQGTGGAATWEYVVRACTALSCTDGSATGTTALGNATLSVSNFNRLTVATVTGAATYAWYRVTAATSPSTTGFIGVSSTPTLDDTGLAGDGGSPNADEPQTGLGNAGFTHFGVPEYSLLPAVQDQAKGVLLVTNSSRQAGIIVETQGGASGGRGVYGVASSAFNSTGFQAVEGDAYIGGNGQTAYAGAFDCLAFNSTTTTGTCFGIEGFGIISAGSMDLIAGVHAFVLDVGGTITDLVGVEIENVSGGTNNYGIRSHVNAGSNTWAFYGAGTAASHFGGVIDSPLYATTTKCSNAASPAICAAAPAGAVAIPTGITTVSLVVNTTAVTSSSQIKLQADDSLTIAATTCNNTLATLVGGLAVTARTPGTSFTITYNGTIATNPLCVAYAILN